MKTIYQLIQDLCPDGVEYKKLGEVSNVQRGASPRPISNYISKTGEGTPWIKIGDIAPGSKYVEKTEEKIVEDGVNKSRLLHTGDFILSNSMSFGRPYILKIDGCIHDGWASISNFSQFLNSDYLYHLLNSNDVQHYWKSQVNTGSVSNLNSEIIKSTEIPVPPMEGQEKIVEVLDSFTSLITELQDELQARKQQYEYYRNQLLSFEDKKEYNIRQIGELFEIKTGKGVTKKESNSNGKYPIISGGKEPMEFIDKFNRFGDCVTISRVGANAGFVGYQYKPFYLNDKCFSIVPIKRNDHISKFVFYFLKSIEKNIMALQSEGGVPTINTIKVANLEYPLLPLAEQQRIVDILDKFEVLVNDKEHGLPAEIEARQKQYEYYRDRLLTFKRKDA